MHNHFAICSPHEAVLLCSTSDQLVLPSNSISRRSVVCKRTSYQPSMTNICLDERSPCYSRIDMLTV